MREIIIYVEGGGPPSFLDMGRAFETFFFKALSKNVRVGVDIKQVLKVRACGSDGDARNIFSGAASNINVFKMLLVDSDGVFTVSQDCRDHLANKKNWNKITEFDKEQIYLMVQEVEAWFLADLDTLKKFYGLEFDETLLKDSSGLLKPVEQISSPKAVLKRATSNCYKKGKYHEVDHGVELLKLIDPAVVSNASPCCKQLLNTIQTKLESWV